MDRKFDIFGTAKVRDAENRLEAVTVKLDSANKELEKNKLELSILSKIFELTASAQGGNTLSESFLNTLIEFAGAVNAVLLMADAGNLTVKSFKGFPNDALKQVKISTAANFVKVLQDKKDVVSREELYKLPEFVEDDVFVDMRFYLEPDVFIPLMCRGELLGIITLGGISDKERLNQSIGSLYLFGCYMSSALSNEKLLSQRDFLSKELSVALEKKDAPLQRLNKAFASLSLLDAEKLKSAALRLAFETVDVDKAIFFLRSEDEISLVSMVSAGIPVLETKKILFEIDDDFIAKLRENKKPVFLEASRIHETMTACKCNQDTASVLIESGLVLYIPFVSNERLVALLALGPKRSGEEFNSLELELLSLIAFHLAAVIDNAKLFEAGVLDGLTNTHTRRFFEHRLEYELAVGMHYRTQRVLCLIMADLDHFKNINDTYGHQVGDQVLRDFAKIIFGNIRMTDMFARYGGEEFVIIMPEVDLKEGGVIARRMQQSVASFTFLPRDLSLKITASFGVASFPDFAKTKDELIKAADEALYKSKERGRNRVTLCNEK